MTTYKILGVNSDHDSCTCCGKTGLKRVVWMARIEIDGTHGEAMSVGTSCAARLMRCTTTRVDRMAIDADDKRRRAELETVHQVGEVRSVRNWIVESVGNNGGTLTPITMANGLRSVIEKWAAVKYPNQIINVRLPR